MSRALAILVATVIACLGPAAAQSAAWVRADLGARGLRLDSGATESPASQESLSALSWSGSDGAAQPGSVLLDGSPGFPPVANPQTGTVYVPIQCQDPSTGATCNQTASNLVDVINANTCNASTASDCAVVASAVAGDEPVTATVDQSTDTVYVGNGGGSGSLSVVDGATCNASVTSGCGTPLATIKLGGFPAAAALDPATGTLYVASLAGKVFVVDVADCNANTTTGCDAPVNEIADSLVPDGIDVDAATDTVYAANAGADNTGDTVSVIDGATCNATQSSGCDQKPPTITVGVNPSWDAVDAATDTVYVANADSGTVSVINGATCNATVRSGCGQKPPAVLTGTGVYFLSLDTSLHTVFVLNQDDDTMSEINTKTCDSRVTTGCPKLAPDEQLPFNPPQGANPNSFALVAQTGTAYLVNAGGENVLQPVSISDCSATAQSACQRKAPTVPQPEFFPVVDAPTHTIYAGNIFLAQIDVFNAETCKAGHLTGCDPVAKIPMPDPQANLDAIDDTTHTLYASDPFGDTISVINTATCNATDTAGCAKPTPKITTGPAPGPPVLDTTTQTLYASYEDNADRIAVINAASCNAEVTTGCGQHPASVQVAPGAFLIALSQATDTIYAPSFFGDTVSVINGATCKASDHAGCGQLAANVRVGSAPGGVAVDDSTHTLYVSNGADGDSPGTVSIINIATCNGGDTKGCTRTWPTVGVGRGPDFIAADATTGAVYVTDEQGATVSIINGNACNAETAPASPQVARTVETAGSPDTLAIDDQTNTVYTTTSFGNTSANAPTTMSIFRGGS